MERSKEGLYVWKTLYYNFSSPAGLLGAADPGRQPCPLPAAFPGKRGRRGGGQRRIPRKPRFPLAFPSPLSFGSALAPSRPGGEENARPPRGRQGNIWAAAAQTSGAAAAHPGAAAGGSCPGTARAGSETPERGKEEGKKDGGEGAAREGAAQVRAARRPRSPAGVTAGRGDVGSCRLKGQILHVCLHLLHGDTSEVRGADGTFKSAVAFAETAGDEMRARPLQRPGRSAPCARGLQPRFWMVKQRGD